VSLATEVDDRPVAILVTEVDAVVRMTTVDLLTEAGYQTIEARDAQEALALLAEHPSVQLLITGRRLPGDVDGVSLAHIARRYRPDLGIIITTGGSSLEPANLPAGAQLLQKPYGFDTLLREVQRLMLEAHTGTGAPMIPPGLPPSHSGSAEGGAGEIAAAVSEPDKS
jgi:DNA-binding NtrC family response regulator